jgi:hypothetical protein
LRVLFRFSRVSILLSILELLEIVLFAVYLEVILELASLLFDVLGNKVVDVVEKLVNVGLALLDGVLQGLTHGCASLLSESCGVLWLRETTSCQILFKTFNWRLELSEELLPLLHFCIITVPLREVRSRVIPDSI